MGRCSRFFGVIIEITPNALIVDRFRRSATSETTVVKLEDTLQYALAYPQALPKINLGYPKAFYKIVSRANRG